MLANILFIVLLFLVLYGLYRLWRSSLDAAGGASTRADWRRLLLQPHLEAGAAPIDAHRRDGGDADDEGRPTRRQSLMGTAADAASADAGSSDAIGTRERPVTAPPSGERSFGDPPGAQRSPAASGSVENAASPDARPASDPPRPERATTLATGSGESTTPNSPHAPKRAVESTRTEAPVVERRPNVPAPAASEPTTTSAPDASSIVGRPAPVLDEDEDDEDDEEALMEATVDLERFEALEREVETLREVNERTLELERRLAELAAGAPRADATSERPSPDVAPPTETNGMPRMDTFTASVEELRDEVARSPLDPIARRRLMSELETYRLRGRHDDGLLTSVRHQLQRAQSEFRLDDEGTRPPPDEPRERVYPPAVGERAVDTPVTATSLFQAERPRDETERLRADLALRARQIEELRDALARERGNDGLASPFDPVPGRDDLKAIQGIGKRMERVLNELGVTTFAQLAAFEQQHIDRVAERLQDLPDDIEAENWVGQARDLLARRRRERESAKDR